MLSGDRLSDDPREVSTLYEAVVPHKGRRWALKSLGNFCSARLNWHSRSRAGLITAFFGGNLPVRFRATHRDKLPFVQQLGQGARTPAAGGKRLVRFRGTAVRKRTFVQVLGKGRERPPMERAAGIAQRYPSFYRMFETPFHTMTLTENTVRQKTLVRTSWPLCHCWATRCH